MATTGRQPNYTEFHRSVSAELDSVKNRIRNLVRHWPSDGEAKEVALRSVLRRHLPESVIVGRGFIVTRESSSTQIDILVVDASKPTLFKDGDMLIVTPDAVRGVIEVKTELTNRRDIEDALVKLSQIEDLCCEATGRAHVWTGLFVFEGDDAGAPNFLKGLAVAHSRTRRNVDCIAAGKNLFVRYWEQGALVNSIERDAVWHAYSLDAVAPSYFMGNLIDSIGSVDNLSAGFAWFPMIGGKEQHRTHYLSVGDHIPRRF